jgi:hypothetical protein
MPDIDAATYQTAYLELVLVWWQRAYEKVLGNWELELCRQLLTHVRCAPLNSMQRGAVIPLEGRRWECCNALTSIQEAVRTLQRVLATLRDTG